MVFLPMTIKEFLVDSITVFHLFFMALGLGSAIFTDIMMITFLKERISQEIVKFLKKAHKIISFAIVFLWLSGVSLIFLKIGFLFMDFSPKLLAKLAVVIALTLTALAMRYSVLRILEESIGKHLTDLRLNRKLWIAACAAMSVSCWSLALFLGGFKAAKLGGSAFIWGTVGFFWLSVLFTFVAVTWIHHQTTSAASQRWKDRSRENRSRLIPSDISTSTSPKFGRRGASFTLEALPSDPIAVTVSHQQLSQPAAECTVASSS